MHVIQDRFNETNHEIFDTRYSWQDLLGVLNQHHGITGTSRQNVIDDYMVKIDLMQEINSKNIQKIMAERLLQDTDLQVEAGHLFECKSKHASNNENCLFWSQDPSSFVMIAYNPKSVIHNHLLRLRIPNNNYRVLTWSKK